MTDISDALDRATRHLSPSPDLLEQVRRSGDGRRVRRRSLLGAGLFTAIAGGSAAAWWSEGRSPALTGSWLLDRPTAGDLADDVRYLRQVRAEWAKIYDAPPNRSVMRGDPHVVWAGSTPAGPAAFVAQRYTTGADSLSMAVTFLEPTASGPKLVSQINYTPGDLATALPRAVLLGESRDVLVVLDTGEPVRWSERPTYRSDGRVDRMFQPVTFDDGAAVLRVPPQRSLVSIAVLAGTPNPADPVGILNSGQQQAFPPSSASSVHSRVLPDPAKVWPADPTEAEREAESWVAGPLRPYSDPGGHQPWVDGPAWTIRATTPDGRRLSLRTSITYDGKMLLLVVLGRQRDATRIVYGGELIPTAPLPVVIRLPDRQGVLVAGVDVELRYRTARGEWLPVRGDAALLPDAAARVEVTRPDRRKSELPLP